MNEPFSQIYADTYDLVYQDKDYQAECDLVEGILKSHGDGTIRRILDLGCGTGSHAIPLAERGYEVLGVERSESMIAQARRKLADFSGVKPPVFHQADIRDVNLQQHFDAVLMMFAVLGYQLKNADVISALQVARGHLRPDGLLIFDVWYGPAVLRERPSQRIKVIPIPNGTILRVASGELDIGRHLCTIDYHIWRIESGHGLKETDEKHKMRYFFPMELELFLEYAGLKLIRLGAFPEFDHEPNETTWNIMGVARKPKLPVSKHSPLSASPMRKPNDE